MPKPKPDIQFWATSKTVQEAGGTHGVPIELVDNAESEKADLVICVQVGEEAEHFKVDNIYTNCVDCGCAITHRPHAPKKPDKVCIACAIKRLEKEQCDA